MKERGMDDRATAIWQEVHERLRRFIAKRVADEAEVDDLLQEVFVRVHRHLDQLQEPERLVPWIFRITRHVIIDHYRAPKRHREVPVGLANEMEASVPESTDDAMPAAAMELSGCLGPMIARLSEDYRQAITLVEIEGLTQKQAAERLGLSIPGMKSRVQRGRQQLRKLLEDCCLIELDRRRGVTDFELRRPQNPPC
jgi:RNA polymerase sigma-70 factor (ECF subfamily)